MILKHTYQSKKHSYILNSLSFFKNKKIGIQSL